MIPKRFRRRSADEDVAARADQARRLADIPDQDLFDDARTNPAVRATRDRLRDTEQTRTLELAHARALRRGRVTDRRAADAEKALEAIAAARESLSPARAVIALQRGRRRFLGGALAASVALSAGSAMGLAAVATHTGGPAAAGWIAEVALTVATTAAILYRSHIDQATTRDDAAAPTWAGWRGRLLLTMVVVPLLTSVTVNLTGWAVGAAVSPISALCAAGSASAAGFAYLVASVSARAIRINAAAVRATDEAELRRVASGHADQHERSESAAGGPSGQGHPATPGEAQQADVEALTEHGIRALGDFLAARDTDAGQGGVGTLEAPDPGHDSGRSGKREHDPEDPPEIDRGGDGHDDDRTPTQAASDARRRQAEERRDTARELWDQGLTVAEIADRMNRKRATVTGYLLDRFVTKDAMASRTRDR